MKPILALIVIVISSNVSGQSYVKENILNQLNNLIENGYELLGKTEYEILSNGRPLAIRGGSRWKTYIKIPDENEDTKKFIHIETGTGSLITLYVSKRTNLVYQINFTPMLWASFDEVKSFLENRYSINKEGVSYPIKTSSSQFISFQITMWDDAPYVILTGIDMEKRKTKFF
jgi:hypothetical protein